MRAYVERFDAHMQMPAHLELRLARRGVLGAPRRRLRGVGARTVCDVPCTQTDALFTAHNGPAR